ALSKSAFVERIYILIPPFKILPGEGFFLNTLQHRFTELPTFGTSRAAVLGRQYKKRRINAPL
ncbi:MAG: hypothetical protein IJJ89_01240, partial [Eubacterium sp.]|nr:hypothetical protein [Eubacterium sp.]